MESIIRIIVIAAVVMHGIGHLIGFLGAWTSVPVGTTDAPWLFGGEVVLSSTIGRIFGLIGLAALVSLVAGGFGLATGQAWWPTVLVVGAVVSLAAIVPWWRAVPSGAQFGGVLADVIILVALLPGWKEQVIAFLQ
jgi:hypothetical protein